jgi:lysozyme
MTVNRTSIGAALGGVSLLIATPFIAGWEGKRNDPYRDIVGVQTVCYGETNVNMRRYTDQECLDMLNNSVKGYQDRVLQCSPILIGHPYQLAAATSLSYNIGSSAYCRSTAARRFNQGDFKGGCEAIKLWNKAGGRVVQGLVNRRNAEYNLCVTYL